CVHHGHIRLDGYSSAEYLELYCSSLLDALCISPVSCKRSIHAGHVRSFADELREIACPRSFGGWNGLDVRVGWKNLCVSVHCFARRLFLWIFPGQRPFSHWSVANRRRIGHTGVAGSLFTAGPRS